MVLKKQLKLIYVYVLTLAYNINAPITANHSCPLFPPSPTSSSTSVESSTSENPTTSILSPVSSDRTSSPNQRVKRPPNAFMLFRMEFSKRQRDLAADHDSTVLESDISRNAAVAWRSLGTGGKKPYYEWANEVKSEYALKYPKYRFAPQRRARPTKIVKLETTSSSRGSSPLRAVSQAAEIRSFEPQESNFSTSRSVHDNTNCSTLVPPDILSPTDCFTLCAQDIPPTQHLVSRTPSKGPHCMLNLPTESSLLHATMEQSSQNDADLDYAHLFESFDLLDEADFGYDQYNQYPFSFTDQLIFPPFNNPLHF